MAWVMYTAAVLKKVKDLGDRRSVCLCVCAHACACMCARACDKNILERGMWEERLRKENEYKSWELAVTSGLAAQNERKKK